MRDMCRATRRSAWRDCRATDLRLRFFEEESPQMDTDKTKCSVHEWTRMGTNQCKATHVLRSWIYSCPFVFIRGSPRICISVLSVSIRVHLWRLFFNSTEHIAPRHLI